MADKIGISGPFTDNLVDAMVAVKVLELDEPAFSHEAQMEGRRHRHPQIGRRAEND